jgi:hypothetical protein
MDPYPGMMSAIFGKVQVFSQQVSFLDDFISFLDDFILMERWTSEDEMIVFGQDPSNP